MKNKNEASPQISNPIFRVVYPPIFNECTKKIDQITNNSEIACSSLETKSNISPSKSLYKIDTVSFNEPISEVIRRMNDYCPPRDYNQNEKFQNNEKKHTTEVFRIDDKLYFESENIQDNKNAIDKVRDGKVRKLHKKKEGKSKCSKKREKIENFASSIKVSLNTNTKLKSLVPLKKIIKKVKKNSSGKKKWGYIKNDFFYYESKKPSFGNSSEKEHLIIKIPLQVIKSQ